MKIFKHILALLFVLTQLNSLTFAQEEGMDKMWGKQKPEISDGSERGKFFSDGNYAMFIHWGIYSNLANEWKGKTYYGIGEWIKHKIWQTSLLMSIKKLPAHSIPQNLMLTLL
jgi:alpha-L-fucosidase